MTLTVGSLFSGIGGLDLGLERAGMRVIWQSEIDPYACRVLKKHWPEVPNLGNIKEVDWADVARPDVICGGYPCQPFSTAGYRRGADDPRHLWPWVRDAISYLRPHYAILENVRGHLTLGGAQVLADLTSIGYDAEWHIIRASATGASHRRERLIIVAYPAGLLGDGGQDHSRNSMGSQSATQPRDGSRAKAMANPDDARRNNKHDYPVPPRADGTRDEVFKPSHSSRCIERLRSEWLPEPDVGRVADGVPARVDRLRGLGNAVVPQVAEVIGRLVVAHYESVTA